MQINPYNRFQVQEVTIDETIINSKYVFVIIVILTFSHRTRGKYDKHGWIKAVLNEGRYFTMSDNEHGAMQFETREEAHTYADMLMAHLIDKLIEEDLTGYLDGYINLCDNFISRS